MLTKVVFGLVLVALLVYRLLVPWPPRPARAPSPRSGHRRDPRWSAAPPRSLRCSRVGAVRRPPAQDADFWEGTWAGTWAYVAARREVMCSSRHVLAPVGVLALAALALGLPRALRGGPERVLNATLLVWLLAASAGAFVGGREFPHPLRAADRARRQRCCGCVAARRRTGGGPRAGRVGRARGRGHGAVRRRGGARLHRSLPGRSSRRASTGRCSPRSGPPSHLRGRPGAAPARAGRATVPRSWSGPSRASTSIRASRRVAVLPSSSTTPSSPRAGGASSAARSASGRRDSSSHRGATPRARLVAPPGRHRELLTRELTTGGRLTVFELAEPQPR